MQHELAKLGMLGCCIVLSISCSANKSVTFDISPSGREGANWDSAELLAIDGRRVSDPQRAHSLSPGRHELLFRRGYLRGNMRSPIDVEVPVTVTFEPESHYRAHTQNESPSLLGVTIEKQRIPPEGGILVGGTFIYSPEFSLYQQSLKR